MKSLDKLRKDIDDLDTELLKILSNRLSVAKDIGKLKTDQRLKYFDKVRKDFVMEKWLNESKNLNLSTVEVKKLYKLIHKISINIEKKNL